MNNWFVKIPKEYLAYAALALWGGLSFLLLHKTPYGIDEGAARSMLLIWSLADHVVSPVLTMGFPDFRTAFLAPVGFLWTGSVVAAKISTMLVLACAVWAIHTWRLHSGNSESALLATGLLLISPLMIDQIDTVSVAPYLLVTFGLGAWLDQIYRDTPHAFGGMYFAQLFLCLVSVTFHPIGLAYPLALLWAWHTNPIDKKHQKYFFIGIIFTAVFGLFLTMGWSHITWFTNPIRSLSRLFSGLPVSAGDIGAGRWVIGSIAAIVLLVVVWKQARDLWADFLGRALLLALAIGVLVGDETWSIIALAVCLYWGLPLLLKTRAAQGFWGQRGIALFLVFVVSTVFMLADKARYQVVQADHLSPRDSLIRSLAEDSGQFSNDSNDAKKPVRVASQWPGLTMLACRCDALPLPPAVKDSDALLAMLRGIDFLIFDPRDPVNSSLSRNLALIGPGKIETVALQPGGVIVEIKDAQPEPKK